MPVWTAVGRQPEKWQEKAREIGADVEFPGPVSDEDLELYWREALCAVVPSRYERGFGLVAIEAMARGVPVIASRSGALPEVVDSAGILVDSQQPDQIVDAVMRLINEPGLAARLAQLGSERHRTRFSVASFAIALDKLIMDRISVVSR